MTTSPTPDRAAKYDLSIIIVNYNGTSVLPRCIAAIQDSGTELDIETIIVDNGSTDGSTDLPCCREEGTRLMLLCENLGFGKANNVGAEVAQGRYYLLLNSDCFIEPGLLEALTGCLDSHKRAAVVGPRLLNADGTLQPSCHNFPSPLTFLLEQANLWKPLQRLMPRIGRFLFIASPHTRHAEVDWLLGACMLVRPAAFRQVGGFDPGFFFYWEEADLCMRLRKRGWRVRFEPAARAMHLGGGSTTGSTTLLQFFNSLYLFYAKHYSAGVFVITHVMVRIMALLKATRLLVSAGRVQYGTQGAQRRHQARFEEAQAWLRVARL